MDFTVYDPPSGRILVSGETQLDADAANMVQTYPGSQVLLGQRGNDTTHRVVDGLLMERPWLYGFDRLAIAADGVDVATLNLPVAAEVWLDYQPAGTVPAGQALEVGSATPRTIHVRVEAWPYRTYEAEVVAS